MPRAYKIAPSILSADFTRLGEEVRAVEAAGADLIHFDVMDGHFVPNISIGVPVLKSVRKVTRLPLDAHLMIDEPERYLKAFVEAGADLISVHAEVCGDLAVVAGRIRELGVRASVAINPETDPDRVLAAAAHLDMILVMSVHPGFGGQEFIESSVERLAFIRRELDRMRLEIDLEVDGGIKVENAGAVAAAGANVLVSGSGIFEHRDYSATMSKMRSVLVKLQGGAI
jgi:ribulose-phosphate 3-epimerase